LRAVFLAFCCHFGWARRVCRARLVADIFFRRLVDDLFLWTTARGWLGTRGIWTRTRLLGSAWIWINIRTWILVTFWLGLWHKFAIGRAVPILVHICFIRGMIFLLKIHE
jgi:hypothetical protein